MAFEPQKAPTVKEIADAQSDASVKVKLYFALVAGLAMAGFGLVRGWDYVMWGGVAVAASSGFGLLLAKSLDDHPWISIVVTAGLAVSAAAVVIYFTKIKPKEAAISKVSIETPEVNQQT